MRLVPLAKRMFRAHVYCALRKEGRGKHSLASQTYFARTEKRGGGKYVWWVFVCTAGMLAVYTNQIAQSTAATVCYKRLASMIAQKIQEGSIVQQNHVLAEMLTLFCPSPFINPMPTRGSFSWRTGYLATAAISGPGDLRGTSC